MTIIPLLMLALMHREHDFLKTESTRFASDTKRAMARLRTLVTAPNQPRQAVQRVVARFTRLCDRYKKTSQTVDERLATAMLWQVVMLVTCVEAYLQDLLAIAASVDPKVMDETQQVAPYAEVISATSLDELASELRARWARRWLSDGGPTRWISRLAWN